MEMVTSILQTEQASFSLVVKEGKRETGKDFFLLKQMKALGPRIGNIGVFLAFSCIIPNVMW